MARSGAQNFLEGGSAVRPVSVEKSTKVSLKEVLQEIRELADSGDIYIALDVLDNVIDDADSDKLLLEREKWKHLSLPARLARARKACTPSDIYEGGRKIATSREAGAKEGSFFGVRKKIAMATDARGKEGSFFDVLPQLSRNRRCPEAAPLSTSTKVGGTTSTSRRARSTSGGLASGAMANIAAARSAMPRRTRWAW
eukprot:TRINITY_DN21092_c0_g1_i1.p1 TRINITY_DN21092_c0_g1~~TRINITY_DN21092_c0_g1_i1.p1  ORF type:complete len:198 (+),score=34.85 TRINITY_DN21092_c0_g1_i1:127-720(+)